jgi:hypothetical protein
MSWIDASDVLLLTVNNIINKYISDWDIRKAVEIKIFINVLKI